MKKLFVILMVMAMVGLVSVQGKGSSAYGSGSSIYAREKTKGTATFTVAASDSSVQSKRIADYRCSGTDDDVQIQAALDALPDIGGKIVLFDGNFYAESVSVTENATLEGQGRGTKYHPQDSDVVIMVVTQADNIEISHIQFDSTNLESGGVSAIGSPSTVLEVKNLNIHHCRFVGKYHSGGAYPASSTDASFTKVIDPGYLTGGNISDNDFYGYSYEAVSISAYLQSSNNYCSKIIISRNTCIGGYGGIVLEAKTKHSIVSNNVIWSKIGTDLGYGIYVIHDDTKYNIIEGNVVLMAQQYGIWDTGQFNIIQSNTIVRMEDNSDGIGIYGGELVADNLIMNCPAYGVNNAVKVEGNVIIRTDTGVATNVAGRKVANNQIINCHRIGISANAPSAPVVTGNTVSCCGQRYAESIIMVSGAAPSGKYVIVRNNRICDWYADIDTTLTAAADANSSTIVVASTDKIYPGQYITTEPAGGDESHEVKDIDYKTKTLTLVETLTNDHANSVSVVGRYAAQYTKGVKGFSNCDRVIVEDNDFYGIEQPIDVSSLGSNSKVRGNIGWCTENWGSSTGTGAEQTIAHGLKGTPTIVVVSGDVNDVAAYQDTAATSTNIYLTVTDGEPYHWEAKVR